MLTDEELKAIEEGTGHQLQSDPEMELYSFVDLVREHFEDETARDEIERRFSALLSEVKRLRDLMRGQTFVSESGWQSVADGAKPGPTDWYVAAHVERVRNMDALGDDDLRPGEFLEDEGDVVVTTYARPRFPGNDLPRGTTHFLVIPAPPVRRESKEPGVYPISGLFEMSVPAEQISDRYGESAKLCGTITVKVLREGVDAVTLEVGNDQMQEYCAAGGPSWRAKS